MVVHTCDSNTWEVEAGYQSGLHETVNNKRDLQKYVLFLHLTGFGVTSIKSPESLSSQAALVHIRRAFGLLRVAGLQFPYLRALVLIYKRQGQKPVLAARSANLTPWRL